MALGLILTGCGFTLRGQQNFAFDRIAITPVPGGPVALELRRTLGDRLLVQVPGTPMPPASVVLNIQSENREKVVVGVSTSGQVREFQLRVRVRLNVTTSKGKEIMEDIDIVQQRDFSYNESAALAKEAEEALLYSDMQQDIVQQILRRLAAIKQIR